MKIRSDFVTNSSSSSFILGFTSEEAAEKELALETAITDEEKKTVLFDCKRSGFVPIMLGVNIMINILIGAIRRSAHSLKKMFTQRNTKSSRRAQREKKCSRLFLMTIIVITSWKVLCIIYSVQFWRLIVIDQQGETHEV